MEICKCTRRLGGTTMLRFVSLIIFLLEEGERFSLCVSIYLIKTGQKKTAVVTTVFTSAIHYTTFPQLLVPHLITILFFCRSEET